MFILKKKYFLLIENTKDIDLSIIKKRNKFIIIYRKLNKPEDIESILKFRQQCKSKSIKFFIANNYSLAIKTNSDGVYISANNHGYKSLNLKRNNFDIIGSAHNIKELNKKIKQGCSYILLSRLFRVTYKTNLNFLGVCKFNIFLTKTKNKVIPLGGINLFTLNHLKNIHSEGLAIMSEIKKKPTKLISRLF